MTASPQNTHPAPLAMASQVAGSPLAGLAGAETPSAPASPILSRREKTRFEYELGRIVTRIVSGRATDEDRARRNVILTALERDNAVRAAARKEAA